MKTSFNYDFADWEYGDSEDELFDGIEKSIEDRFIEIIKNRNGLPPKYSRYDKRGLLNAFMSQQIAPLFETGDPYVYFIASCDDKAASTEMRVSLSDQQISIDFDIDEAIDYLIDGAELPDELLKVAKGLDSLAAKCRKAAAEKNK